MIRQTVSSKQLALWFILHQLGSAFLLLPGILASMAKQDAWISVLLSLSGYMLLVPMYAALAKRLRGQTFHEYLEKLLGRWLGSALTLVFVLGYPFFIFILVLSDLSDFVTTVFFPETPPIVIQAGMLLPVLYALKLGIASIGRAADLLFYAVLFLFCLGYLSLVPAMNPTQLLPVLEYGWKPPLHASITLLAFPYVETAFLLFLAPYADNVRRWNSLLAGSALVSGSMFLFMTLLSIGVLGEAFVANMLFPSYTVVTTISYGDFYERFEVIVGVLWYLTIFFRLALLLFVTADGLAGVFRLNDYRSLLIGLSLIGLVAAGSIQPNAVFFLNTLKSWPYYGMTFGIAIPLVIWLTGAFRSDGKHS